MGWREIARFFGRKAQGGGVLMALLFMLSPVPVPAQAEMQPVLEWASTPACRGADPAQVAACAIRNSSSSAAEMDWNCVLLNENIDNNHYYCYASRGGGTWGSATRLGEFCPENSVASASGTGCDCKPGFEEADDPMTPETTPQMCRLVAPPVSMPVAAPNAPAMCLRDGLVGGNPIQFGLGKKVQSEVDYVQENSGLLSFVRYYDSAMDALDPVFGLRTDNSSLGRWRHSFQATMQIRQQYAFVLFPEGSIKYFKVRMNQNVWPDANGSGDAIERVGWNYVYRRAQEGDAWVFSQEGWLIEYRDRSGPVLSFSHNTSGYVLAAWDRYGQALQFSYNYDGRMTSLTTPGGQRIDYTYDGAGRLAQVTYPDGTTKGYLYEDPSRPRLLTGIRDENGVRFATFGYDPQGRAVRTEHAGGVLRYSADYAIAADGQIGGAAVTDPLGTLRHYTFTGRNGELGVAGASLPSGTGQPDAASREQTAEGLTQSETDFLGRRTTTTWDSARRLPLTVTEAVGTPEQRTTTTEWHAQWRLPVRITEAGRETAITYDSAGRPLSTTVTDTTVSPAQSRTSQWTYHADGRVASATDPGGATSTYQYDSLGNLTEATDPLGRRSTYTHDAAGRVLTATGPSGIVASYQYDLRGRLLSATRAGLTHSYTWRPSGQLASVALPGGYSASYRYDAAQRLVGWSDNRGASGSYTLDAMGNRVAESVQDAQGTRALQIARTLNALNRPDAESVGALQSTRYGYDANGEPVSQTRTVGGLDRTTHWGLDALRRVQRITDAQNASATLAHDARDAVVQATDFNGVATGYTRDALGNALQEITPDGGPVATTYDALGLPQAITDALGRASSIARDPLGRPTQIVSSSTATGAGTSSRTTVLRYDLPGPDYNAEGAPLASVGHLSEIQDPEVTTRYQRDLQGRIVRKTEILANGDTRTLGYRYAEAGSAGAGQIAAITYPSGRQLQYQYDATGQPTGLTWNGQPLLSGLAWNPLGQPTAWQWSGLGPAQSEQRSYTTAGPLAASRLLPELAWDGAGRVTRIQQRHALPGTGNTAQEAVLTSVFTYDGVGRLTASAHSAPAGLALPLGWGLGDTLGATASGYAWDANGNRTQMHHTSATGAGSDTLERLYTLAAGSNRLQGYVETFTPAGSAVQVTPVAYSQDAAGALTRKGDTFLHYGVDGRIAKAGANADASNALAVSYTTNALGQRVFKRDTRLSGSSNTPAITQQTVYAEDGIGSTVLGQYGNARSSDSAAPAGEMDSTEVIWLPTATGPLPVAAQINGRLYAIDADHLNTPRRLTNAQGQVVWQWLITGFGEANPTTGATGYAQSGDTGIRSYGEAVRFDLRYPGQVWDEETGLNYNLHRYYDAGSGRYIQADPIGLEGGWNRFGYVGADPLNFADDDGLQRRSAVPPVSYAQNLLNAQGVNLTSQIRQYQPNYAPMYVSAPGQGFTAANIGQLQGILQSLQNGNACSSITNTPANGARFINGVQIIDRSTGNSLQGTVDLQPTLDRIATGGRFPHRNDGSIFGNKEGLLPQQSRGYYTEYVHPTPGFSGPGPQRIVTGQGGEVFYTPNHYRTFIQVRP
ncbi:RHS repeat-associated core domain-containing protein [Acidovorax sp. NCPPB 4044]|uniref:RHS repeat-associated core domain-containing protein n=1 Tax=Acidovorax sp. NCPPB 4044 TaxID=2940490 RepID=UPI002303687C|nr:RHS repeat-associated core domain-containing protein [Acidovorax sp. NCPPB 4044]MDA8523437.1 hypothetical protein [Acidovorax sp. NCPPB 4044]